ERPGFNRSHAYPGRARRRGGRATTPPAALAHGLAVDGHAPGMAGQDLQAHVAAGIRSDHESSTLEEARAKAALGMLVQVREGSSARNLDALLPLLVADGMGDFWCLVTDYI